MKKYKIAVVGATGAVGREMIRMLEMRNFPIESIKLLASERSAGTRLPFGDAETPVEALKHDSGQGVDIALFSAGGGVSKKFAPSFAKAGCFVIDNSSAWRMDPNVPLVVPEVNPDDLSADKKIIANPNCSTIQMVLVLKPLHNAARIKRAIVSTYQSVSGAGQKGMAALDAETRAWAAGEPMPAAGKFPYQIAFNLIPQIDVFDENGYTKEEIKMSNETRKILGDDAIKVSATCVRAPVFRSHSESVWIETERPLGAGLARELLAKMPGIEVVDNPAKGQYPMPLFAEGRQTTQVGRIREDISAPGSGLTFWIVSDNLLKGAALNAVQIAEKLIEKELL